MALSKYWLTHIKDWQRSGLSQAACCRQHDLNANSFTGRLSEFRKQESIAPAELIPIKVKAQKGTTQKGTRSCAKRYQVLQCNIKILGIEGETYYPQGHLNNFLT